MAGQPRAVRRMDGDGNGLLTDAQDRVWIDLNGDGHWDASAEQFLYATILNLDGARYVLRSDPLGTRLALEPLLGTGTVRLALKKAAAAELHATLVGRDGSAFGLTGDEAATVPVGEYRLGTVTATYSDPQGGQSWSFIFSDNGAKPEVKWYSLGKDGQLNLDPIGALEMELSITDKVKTAKAGEDIALTALALHRRRALDQRRLSRKPGLSLGPGVPGRGDHPGDDRRPDPGHGPLGLCLRHLLPGLGSSAPVAAHRPRSAFRRIRLRPPGRCSACHGHAGGGQEAVSVVPGDRPRRPRRGCQCCRLVSSAARPTRVPSPVP